MQTYNKREDVPEKYKWDLTAFYKDEDSFNKEFEIAKKLNEKINRFKGTLKETNKLYEYLEENTKLDSMLDNLFVYSYLKNDEVLGIASSIERKEKVWSLLTSHSLNTSFFEPELLSFTDEEYNNLFNDNKLNNYKAYLDDIYRFKAHVLSEKEEQIMEGLIMATNKFDEMSSMMLNSLNEYGKIKIDDEDVTITTTNYRKLMKNKDREKRKEIRDKFSKVLNQYSSLSALYLGSFVNLNSEEKRIRGYSSAFDAKIFGLKMPNKAYETLVKNVENSTKLYQKYLDLFKNVHGFNKLYPYDLNLDLAGNETEYSVEDAMKLCLNAIKPLGDDYYNKFKKIFDNRYIDFMGYKGKCSGGYSFSTSTNDSRILMSYNYDLDSVSTIIHEGGHNVHHQYVKENNPVIYREVPSLVSEVASLTNECLLSNYLMKNGKTKEEKLAGIANIINVINSNLFGAVREGKMEQDFYEYVQNGNSLTDKYLNKLTIDSLKKYYGNKVKLDDYSSLGWIRRSHYYMNFYLYAYSFSISVATYVASEILNGNKDMLDKYLAFLKTGGDKYPCEMFEILGIDLTKDEVYQKALNYYDNMLNEFEKIRKEC